MLFITFKKHRFYSLILMQNNENLNAKLLNSKETLWWFPVISLTESPETPIQSLGVKFLLLYVHSVGIYRIWLIFTLTSK